MLFELEISENHDVGTNGKLVELGRATIHDSKPVMRAASATAELKSETIEARQPLKYEKHTFPAQNPLMRAKSHFGWVARPSRTGNLTAANQLSDAVNHIVWWKAPLQRETVVRM